VLETRQDLRRAIVESAARLLQAGGPQAVTTRAVAEAAGTQAPTIYRLFTDKDGLLDAVAEHVMAEYVASKSIDAHTDPVADLRAGWRTHVEFGLANPHLYALLGKRTSPAAEAGRTVLQARVRRLAEAGLLRTSEAQAVAMIEAAGAGTVLGGDPALADPMFAAVCAAILTDTPAAPPDDLTALVVQFAAAIPRLPTLTDTERALLTEWLARPAP
jgi:AcrR family transcriptional regulator